jgi:hypothetical protein
MILQSLVGVSLIVSVSIDSGTSEASRAPTEISAQQKTVIMQPLVRSATECVMRAVSADPRTRALESADLREIIVSSMPACAERMRAMIDAHDKLYGEGSGEIFFMGPYLDTLPTSVLKAVKDSRQ